jgi:nitrile hydratase
VNGVHDLGGMHGFGPVDVADGESFHADWEARVFGIVMAMTGARRTTATAARERYEVELMEPASYLTAPYFERWLFAAERVYESEGLVTADELEQRVSEMRSDTPLTGESDPAFVEQTVEGAVDREPSRRELDSAPRFAVGAEVVARNIHTPAHTRLPGYLRGRAGRVEELCGAFDLPERAAIGEHVPEHLYVVAFEGAEVWGEAAEPNTTIRAQLWESYLEGK